MNTFLSLIITALTPVIASVLLYLLFNTARVQELSYWTKQVIAGLIFGAIAICGTEFGIPYEGAIINARDAAPLCAGLIFGGPAGIIAGLIGGIERWFSVYWGIGYYTRVGCTISTILAGFVAARARVRLFDGHIPHVMQSVLTSSVMEVAHMLMIFLTNMSDVKNAFNYVRICTIPMVILNTAAVVLATYVVRKIKHMHDEDKSKQLSSISSLFQKYTFAVILLTFFLASVFSNYLQRQLSGENVKNLLYLSLMDTVHEVEDQCDKTLLQTNKLVVNALESNPDADLKELKKNYNVYEINVIDKNGIITASSETHNVGFNMASGEQSNEFMRLLRYLDITEYVQSYQPTTANPDLSLKYSGVRTSYGIVQVAYSGNQINEEISSVLQDVVTNRHVGETGKLLIFDNNNQIISTTSDMKLSSSTEDGESNQILDPAGKEEYAVYESIIAGEPYYCMFTTTESYSIMSIISQEEADFSKQLSVYLNTFTYVITLGMLFGLIYFIVKRLVVEDMRKINRLLGQITDGNLDTVVDVRSTREFNSLSDDINQTVDALKRYIAEANARIDSELQYAREIQSSALPSHFPAFPDRDEFDIYALMKPAREVGGDFYDFYFAGENRLAFLVADVSGKGIPASLFMMRAKTTLKTLAENDIAIADIFTNANYQLCSGNDATIFVTAWMGILDLETGELKYANAGHNSPLIRRKDGRFEYLKGNAGFVLAGLEGVRYKEQSAVLEPGDEIFLYTDGVVEAMNAEKQLYGESRLEECINRHIGEDARSICLSIKQDVDVFYAGAPQFDDITELSLQFKKYCVRKE